MELASYLFNGLQIIATISIPIGLWVLNRIFKVLDSLKNEMKLISHNDIKQDGKIGGLEKSALDTIKVLDKTRNQVFENKDEILKMRSVRND